MTQNLDEKPVETASGKKRGGCLKIGLIVIVLLLAVLHFVTPVIVRTVANKELPKALGTEASLDRVSIFLPGGRVGLQGLQIEQPEGFEGLPLFRLGSLSVAAPLGRALGQNPVTVNHLRLDDLFVRIISNEDGELNVARLGPPVDEEVEVEAEEAGEVPPVWIREIVISNLNLVFEDLAQEWLLEVVDFDLSLTDLRIAGAGGAEGPAELDGSFEIVNADVNAQFRILGKIGMIQPDQPERVPPIQLAVGLTGFSLDIVQPFMVRGARTALGGSALDFWLFLEIGEGSSPEDQTLAGSYALVTDQNHRYGGNLGGTVERPVLPFLNIFGDVVGNQFGRITSLGGNVAEGGIEAARAVGETGAAAVRGATGVVTGAAGGLLRTARGVATLDVEEATGGLRDTTVGTVSGAAGTVTDTVGTAGSGVARAGGAALGQEAVRRWWEAVDERAALFEAEAEAWFASRPFPE
ncbi:MAG: hypothetical protein JJU05_19065 [Verrucomicrobia bacterium]|nr:hypothetical protein [Verrucomicrobiota bacterium]MCH8527915.1 hypothetical protein [Kiritimatiellia bacterium]